MNVVVNGSSHPLRPALSIDDLLVELNLKRELVAVELNRQIVRRIEYSNRLLSDGDAVEIVEFVGGG